MATTTDTAQASASARTLPQLAVACPTCQAQPGDLCTSHGGTRIRRYDTHQARTAAYRAAEQAAQPTEHA